MSTTTTLPFEIRAELNQLRRENLQHRAIAMQKAMDELVTEAKALQAEATAAQAAQADTALAEAQPTE